MTRSVQRAAIAALWVAFLAGCDSGAPTQPNDAAGSTGSNPPASNNQRPVISIRPESVVLVGRELEITPTARDPEGAALTFSVENKPEWMRFSAVTGELRGTPSAAHVGTYADIRVTASDGQAQASATTSIQVVASAAGRVTLTWTAPTERTDGSPLTNLAGFKIYFGASEHDLRYVIDVADAGARSWVVEDLTPGTWYFAANAVDTDGLESAKTSPVSKRL